jgi:hemerythrin superfamily protein
MDLHRPANTGRETTMNAISLLEEDHRKMKKLLSELESTTERGVKTREELFATVKEELTVHETIEEEIFYPALKEHTQDQGDHP